MLGTGTPGGSERQRQEPVQGLVGPPAVMAGAPALGSARWRQRVLQVPEQCEFLVRNGKVYPIIEASSKDHTDEYWAYEVYIEVDDEGDEVEVTFV
jgi:hypothetical protein